MFTKEQLLQVLPDVPSEFFIEDLLAILNRKRQELPAAKEVLGYQNINRIPGEAAGWSHYTSPAALALYAKFPISPAVAALRGIAANLPPADLQKSAKEWEAERIREKYDL